MAAAAAVTVAAAAAATAASAVNAYTAPDYSSATAGAMICQTGQSMTAC